MRILRTKVDTRMNVKKEKKREGISFHNYMNATEALFKGCKVPKRKPDFISLSGSKYWQQENSKGKYVIRLSDHWVNLKEIGSNEVWKDCDRIASCQWHIKTTRTQWGCMLLIPFKLRAATAKCENKYSYFLFVRGLFSFLGSNTN